MHKKEGPSSDLLPLLEQAQENSGWVSERDLKTISKETSVPISRVYAVASFYSQIHLKRQGQFIIEVCNSPSCYLNGSVGIIEFLENELGIKSGETTEDGLFSLHICSCIGCCDKAPAMMINKRVYGNLTEEKIVEIIKECRYSEKQI